MSLIFKLLTITFSCLCVCFEQFVHSKDNLGIWHRLPVILGLIHLAARRHLHQEYNLLNVGQSPSGVRFNPGNYPYRTSDGRFNDPFNEGAGSQGSFFGRNMLPVDHKHKVLYGIHPTSWRKATNFTKIFPFFFHFLHTTN